MSFENKFKLEQRYEAGKVIYRIGDEFGAASYLKPKRATPPPSAAERPDSASDSSPPQTNDNDAPIRLYISNVVCSYSTRCHLNLRRIAMEGMHVEYKKENGMVNMKLRKPHTTATIWSSGKVTCAGAKSECDAYKAARRFCRLLQRMQFKVRLSNYRVVNVLATCTLPFGIDIARLAASHQTECSYEPELHPGATYKIKELNATLKLFTTGSVTLTAPSVQAAQQAVNRIHPVLREFKRSLNDDCGDRPVPVIPATTPVLNTKLEPIKSEMLSVPITTTTTTTTTTTLDSFSHMSGVASWKPYDLNYSAYAAPSTLNITPQPYLTSPFGSAGNYKLLSPTIISTPTTIISAGTPAGSSGGLFSPTSGLGAGGLGSYSSSAVNSTPAFVSPHCFYDNLLVDNGDDFLP